MDWLVEVISQNIEWAPYVCFIALLLAGVNIPISEDVLIIACALLAAQQPDYTLPLFMGIFWGAYIGDQFSFAIGRILGPKIWSHRFFRRMVKPEKVEKVRNYFHKYGAATLIIGRFIPFGVRNALFITAGLTKVKFRRFAMHDFIACLISNTTLFSLTYYLGDYIAQMLKKYQFLLLIIVLLVVAALLLRRHIKKKRAGKKIVEELNKPADEEKREEPSVAD